MTPRDAPQQFKRKLSRSFRPVAGNLRLLGISGKLPATSDLLEEALGPIDSIFGEKGSREVSQEVSVSSICFFAPWKRSQKTRSTVASL